MKIKYSFHGREQERDLFANILLTNRAGSFFSYTDAPFSKYSGLFFNEGMDVIKSVEAIRLHPYTAAKSLTHRLRYFEVERETGYETFLFPKERNALLYEHSTDRRIEVNLDCRKAYDGKVWGRYYDVFVEDGIIVIRYEKKTDRREDQSENEREYGIYTAIVCDNPDYELIDRWYEQFYPYDFERQDADRRGIYQAITINAKRIAVSSSKDKHKAMREAKEAFDGWDKEKKDASSEIEKERGKRIKDKDIDLAYLCSMDAIASMLVSSQKRKGVYAGLPWFFQFWTRDTALSIKALILLQDYAAAKEILLGYLDRIRDDGWIENRHPHADLDSADAVGLVFFRLGELIGILDERKMLAKYFSDGELKGIKTKLEHAIYAILKHHTQNDFVVNRRKETWMDTDSREGVRAEIQALQLSMFSLLARLAKREKDRIAESFADHGEKSLLSKVRKYMYVRYLHDGINDNTIRPNVFLAYYFFPGMLLKSQWERTFDHALLELFLPWGGLTTIDKNHPEFQKRHTGMNDRSYHKGDSWFFVNNIAAIAMYRLDKDKYKKYIDKILEASTGEILQRGVLGYHAELSSAEFLDSRGCLAQSWSSATYVELVREVLRD